jgi:hypothetical protein
MKNRDHQTPVHFPLEGGAYHVVDGELAKDTRKKPAETEQHTDAEQSAKRRPQKG